MSAAWQKKKKNVVNMSRLHLAAATGSVQELDELISMKMDVNALSGEGTNGRQTPLMLAARNGHLEPVIKLLRSGARLETQDCYGQTALLRAVRGGQVAVVRVILENKANIDHQDHYGVTALHMGVEMDSAEMVSLLVSFGASIEIKSNNKCQFPFMSPFRLAVALNSTESAQELLDLKADVDSKDSHGTTALLDALSRQKQDLLRLIIRHRPNLYVTSRQTEGVLPLSYAAGKLKVPFIVMLVEAKADVNRVDLGGKTALHFAARTNNVAAIEYLLRVGADYTLRDKTNRDPASYGNQYGSKDAVKLLEAAWMNSGGSPKTADPLSQVKQKYTIIKKLGEGAFGKVLAVKHKKNGIDYACKFIKRKKLSESAEAYLDSEIEIMFEVPHPGICRLYEVIKTKQAVCLIMEVLRGGDVLQKIVEKDILDEKEAARVVRSVASTLGFLHSLGIIHRDLKPDNLMYRSKDHNSDIVIVDFGVAKHLDSTEKFATSACGTPLYLAPEVITGPQYTQMCDMWSLGVILYVMLCGRPPFYAKDRSHLFRKIKDGSFTFPDKYWKHVSSGAKDLITRLLQVDPRKRATPKQIGAHPWVKQHAGLKYQDAASESKVEGKTTEQMEEGYASLLRVVNFLIAVKRLYQRFDLGTIDGASLRLLGGYRQGSFKTKSYPKNPARAKRLAARHSVFRKMDNNLQKLMVVRVKDLDGDFVLERKYDGEIKGMAHHWWVSSPTGQMHVVSPDDIAPIDREGKAIQLAHATAQLTRRNSYVHNYEPLDMNLKLVHEMKLFGPLEEKGKVLKWNCTISRDDLMELLSKSQRVSVMFWSHVRLFMRQFRGTKADEHKMASEAKRIQLIFLKRGSSLKPACVSSQLASELDHLITQSKVNGQLFDKAARMCQMYVEGKLWDRIATLIEPFESMFAKVRREEKSVLRNRLSLVLPRRLLDLMGCTTRVTLRKIDEPIYQAEIEIAAIVTEEEQTNDMRARLQKILSSELYTELQALAKVLGEDSDLLVPGRRLHYAAMVRKKSRMVFSSMSERKLVLCNDLLAWITPKRKLQRFLLLDEIEITEGEEGWFSVLHQKKSYDFFCKSLIEAKAWVAVISRAKEECKKIADNKGTLATERESEGVLKDIKHNRERLFSRMKRHTLRDLVAKIKKGVSGKHHRSKGNRGPNTFHGEDLVKWMLSEKLVHDVPSAVRIGNELVVNGYIEHVDQAQGFKNAHLLYRINDKLVRVGNRGAAVVRSLSKQKTYSFSQSSTRAGGNAKRITWVECTAKVVWKIEGRTKVPHAVLSLWSASQTGGEDSITLADAKAEIDQKDPLKIRVVPGGCSVTEDDSYFEEYQIKCPTTKQRGELFHVLKNFQAHSQLQNKSLRRVIERAEQAVKTLGYVRMSHSDDVGTTVSNLEAKIPPNARMINVRGVLRPIYFQNFVQAGDFPFPSEVKEDLEEIISTGLGSYFAESIGEKWSDSMAALWRVFATRGSYTVSE